MLVSRDEEYLGYLAVADTVRDSSKQAIAKLKEMGIAHLVMLTGDNELTAQKVGRDVGVTEIRANCLPEDKVTAVAELREIYDHVVMVGDGINDAPALASANVGIAIGSHCAGHGNRRHHPDAGQFAAAAFRRQTQPRHDAHHLGQRGPGARSQVCFLPAGTGRS